MERPSFKRKSDAEDEGSRKAPKLDGGGGGGAGKMSFAQRMMAKMGYKDGEGLGKGGDGILGAIEVKLRPQGVGLGAVREKTEQAKAEQKRQAQKRGEEYEDSSEEERKSRRKRKDATMARSVAASVASTPAGRQKPKKRYRTAAEIETEAEGLQVPNVLKSLIDATGKEAKLITSTAGLMTPTFTSALQETEAQKIANRARRELESYADSWNELTERNKYAIAEEVQVQQELAAQENELRHARKLAHAVESLQELDLSRPRLADEAAHAWEETTSQLEILQTEFVNDIELFSLTDVAVATISPLFKQEMIDWEPLQKPLLLVPYLRRLRRILGIKKDSQVLAIRNSHDDFDQVRPHKSTTPYESLIYVLWLPKVRTAITNDWDPLDTTTLLTLVEGWSPLLPDFIYNNLVNHLIVSKLGRELQNWNPRASLKRKHANQLPHTWLFPWLQFLAPQQTDPSSSTGLLSEVKRKFRVVLDTWDLSRGIVPGLDAWSAVLGSTLQDALIRHLLPRLAQLLAHDFEVYPPEQDLTPLENVLAWEKFFKPSVLGQLLIAEFFPKWMNTLYAWLTSESVNYEEVGEWYTWWKLQIPVELNMVKAVEEEWKKGLQMINNALELGEEGTAHLAPPSAGPSKPVIMATQVKEAALETPPKTSAKPVEIDFKEIVEEWCAQENLLLMPLREAHDVTGLPLFRITASATGRGGVVVYLKGDIIWAQRKGDKTAWEPAGLDAKLIARAEGK